ncbi:MAG: DNA-binding protein [Flavobacteriaceae bacterium CG18_big_fil_WC_8_21_14_2_50_34_36]|nr:helix-turn-helix domain-containing protein [Flavobacteriia bacterium]PIQ18617.1 MAG: DNA-binding protein [Flavobacteriaceae bacterium CG18_big_fil_WC_8_21_14_2_50_34_36]
METATLVNNTTSERLTQSIIDGVRKELREFKSHFQQVEPDELLTRKETAAFLKISLVCLHDWCNKKILKPKKIGNRTYFSRKEILEQLNNSNKQQSNTL